jgi:hypothetical protein
MAGWRLRQSYGFGAAKLPVAPVFAPGPWTESESAADALAQLADELSALDKRPLARGAFATLGIAAAVALLVINFAPAEQERDQTLPEIVLLEPAPEELLPEPEPEPEPEPLVEPEPEPLPLAEAEPVPPPEAVAPPPQPKPEPAPLPKVEPVRPPPKVQIDAIAKAPEPPPVTPPRVVREAPKRPAPSFKIDPVAPSFAVAATAPPAGQAAPLRAVTKKPAPRAPAFTFPVDPVVAEKPAAPAPPPTLRAQPRAAPVRVASAKPAALPKFDAGPPPARYAEAPEPPPAQAAQRVARAAAKQSAPAAPPQKAFQGVPLGSLAACVSDREEDSLKLEVMAAAGLRRECESRAGRYRFVETKNLNAFLMWIERNPSRRASDRCVELRLALECLAGTPNRRTDKG